VVRMPIGVCQIGCTLAPTGEYSELSVCSSGAVSYQITLTTCCFLVGIAVKGG